MACRRSDISTPPPGNQQSQVAILNSRLRSEMGEVSGKPKFKWGWSEEAIHPFRVMSKGDEPKPVYNYRCQCGVDVGEGKHQPVTVTMTGEVVQSSALERLMNREESVPNFASMEETRTISCPESVIAEPCYELRRLVTLWKNPDGSPIRQQWLLWGWVAPPSPETWEQTYGDSLDYGEYSNGTYEPVTVAGVVAVIRKRRTLPTMDLTVEFCRLLEASREISYTQKMSEWWRLRKLDEVTKHTNAVDFLKDKMGNLNFGTKASLLPGRKAAVSFGGLPKMLSRSSPSRERSSRESQESESSELIIKERRSIVGTDR